MSEGQRDLRRGLQTASEVTSDLGERMMHQQQQQQGQQQQRQHASTESLASVFSQAMSIISRTSSNLGDCILSSDYNIGKWFGKNAFFSVGSREQYQKIALPEPFPKTHYWLCVDVLVVFLLELNSHCRVNRQWQSGGQQRKQ